MPTNTAPRSSDGQHVQVHGEDLHKQDAEPKGREREPYNGQATDEMVGHSLLASRGQRRHGGR